MRLNKNICFIGLPASGKTRIGFLLADFFGLRHSDLDLYIEGFTGSKIQEYWRAHGESGFRAMERLCLFRMFSGAPGVVSLGGGTPAYFDNMDYILKYGFVVYLKIAPGLLINRFEGSERPLFAKEADKLEVMNSLLERRKSYYERADLILDASENEHSIVERVSKYCKSIGIIKN